MNTASFNTTEELLVLTFSNNERLSIWSPIHLSDDTKHFQVHGAKKVLWEWYHYGRPQTEENYYFEEYIVKDGLINFRSNVNNFKKNLSELSINKPAVLLA